MNGNMQGMSALGYGKGLGHTKNIVMVIYPDTILTFGSDFYLFWNRQVNDLLELHRLAMAVSPPEGRVERAVLRPQVINMVARPDIHIARIPYPCLRLDSLPNRQQQ